MGAKTAIAVVQSFVRSVSALGAVEPEAGQLRCPWRARAHPRDPHLRRRRPSRAEGAPLIEFDRGPFDAAAQERAGGGDGGPERPRPGGAPRGGRHPPAQGRGPGRRGPRPGRGGPAERAARAGAGHAPLPGPRGRDPHVGGHRLPTWTRASPWWRSPTSPRSTSSWTSRRPTPAGSSPGQRVAFWAGADARGDSVGTGTVTEVGAALDSATRAVEIRVRVARAARPLKIGETVFGRIAAGVDAARRDRAGGRPRAAGRGLPRLRGGQRGDRARPRRHRRRAHRDARRRSRPASRAARRWSTYGAYGVSDSAKIVPAKP